MEEWVEIYERYKDEVYQFVAYLVGDTSEAQDLTQETFIKAYKHRSQFSHRSSLKTWIFTIARNLAIDQLRKVQRVNLLNQVLGKQPQEQPDVPEELLHLGERKKLLYEAIQSLKPNYRTVIVLRGIQDYSVEEAAQIIGCSENSINVTYHRALKALRVKLMQEAGDYED